MASAEDLSRLLAGLPSGGATVNKLTSLLYEELRGLARQAMLGQSPGHSLQPTAVVHEAYVRLVGATSLSFQSRSHFLALAARTMRQVLVDHARSRRRQKRGGGARKVPLVESISPSEESDPLDLLALDEGLRALAERDERKARVVELRFFGGLTSSEVAEVLELNTRTVDRDARYARAWLRRFLAGEGADPTSKERT